MIRSINLNNYSSIIDIGGNDSTLLNNFIDSAGHLINIDPNASKDNENIELRREFLEEVDFSEKWMNECFEFSCSGFWADLEIALAKVKDQ